MGGGLSAQYAQKAATSYFPPPQDLGLKALGYAIARQGHLTAANLDFAQRQLPDGPHISIPDWCSWSHPEATSWGRNGHKEGDVIILDAAWGTQRVQMPALVMGSTAESAMTWDPTKGPIGDYR